MWFRKIIDDWIAVTLPEYRSIVSARNLDDQRLIDSFGLKVFRKTLSQQRGMNSHDIVAGCVVVLGPSEDSVSQFKFVDIVNGFIQHPATQVEEQVSQSGGFADDIACDYSADEFFLGPQLTFFNCFYHD